MGDERGDSGGKPGLEEIARCRCGRILFNLGELIWGACRACRLLSYYSPTFTLIATTDAKKQAEKVRDEISFLKGLTISQRSTRQRSSAAKKREKRKAHKKRQRRSRAR